MEIRRMKWTMFVFLLVSPGISLATQNADVDSLRSSIEATNAIIDKASVERDYATWAAYYTDDVIVLPNAEPLIRGKKALIENEKEAEKAGFKVISIESSIIELFSCDDLIHEVGEYEVTVEVPGVPYQVTDTGKYLVIWERQADGSLHIKLEMWNNDEDVRRH